MGCCNSVQTTPTSIIAPSSVSNNNPLTVEPEEINDLELPKIQQNKVTSDDKSIENQPEIQNINQKGEDIVFGYIKLNYQENTNVISKDIILIILSYYSIYCEFNKKYHGDDIEFIDNKFVKKINTSATNSLCIFGIDLRMTKYKQFDLVIKWKKCVRDFRMGFIHENIQNSIKRWNDYLGHTNSVGIYVYKHYRNFELRDKYNTDVYKKLSYKSNDIFKQNDIFMLSFNLLDNVLIIYHNDNMGDKLLLNEYKIIIPAFSLEYHSEELEIIKYQFT